MKHPSWKTFRKSIVLLTRSMLTHIWCSKVHLLEDSTGNIHLKNLSMHQATNEEEGEVKRIIICK